MVDEPSREGKGHITLTRHADTQVLSTLSFQYPLKLLSPRGVGQPCTSVFMMSYGGGLIGGDQISLSVHIEKECKLALLTQGSTKIFKQRKNDAGVSVTTGQKLNVRIEEGGLLVLLPDPIQPFADSAYSQEQVFEMLPESNLMLLDWLNSGRPARGENWTLSSFRSRNDVYEVHSPTSTAPSRRLVLRDTLILNSECAKTMYPHECFATLIIRGPLFKKFSEDLVEKFKSEEKVRRPMRMMRRDNTEIKKKKERATWTAGMVRDGVCVVKVAGEKSEIVKNLLNELLVVEEIEKIVGREALRSLL